MEIYLADGRKQLHQWDVDQSVRILDAPDGAQAHFATISSKTALCCDISDDGLSPIPNILLQSATNLTCYVYDEDHTAYSKTFKVAPRPMPSDYVYTPTAVKTWKQLDERITALEENGGSSSGSSSGDIADATTTESGLMSASDKAKLDSIDENANNYSHPTYTAHESGLYKITSDSTGHVSAVAAVEKEDITVLGIPESDTTYADATETESGLMSAADKAKLNSVAENANAYELPTASESILGGVKVGDGLEIAGDGTLNVLDVETDESLTLSGVPADAKAVGDILADLLYEEIAISSFSNNVGTVEMGSTVSSVTLTWTYNKTPTSATLDGTDIDVSLTSTTLTGLSLTSNKTYTLVATDDRDATATKTTAIYFYNGVYYGVSEAVDSIDSDFLLSLTKSLQSSRAKTVTVTAGDDQYIYYAYPSRFGAATFNVGGFDGGFTLVDTISFTNASGYTESYYVYKSDNANLGSTTVKVS